MLSQVLQIQCLRPLMVQFASYSITNLVMESLYSLKNVEQRFKNIFPLFIRLNQMVILMN